MINRLFWLLGKWARRYWSYLREDRRQQRVQPPRPPSTKLQEARPVCGAQVQPFLTSGEKSNIWKKKKKKKIYYLSFLSSLMVHICNPSPSTGEVEAGEQGCIRWIQGRKYALFLGQWRGLGMQFRGERAPHKWNPLHPIICATNLTFNSFKKTKRSNVVLGMVASACDTRTH